MALRRHTPSTNLPSAADDSDSPLLKSEGSGPGPRLLSRDEMPSWFDHNPYIWTGYRPITPSVFHCLSSLLYLHNETANIYSHLIPALVALLGNGLLFVYFSTTFPESSWSDQFVFHIYLTTSVICFGISSAYHTLLCHSAHFASLWVRLDYVAIVFQILGSFISGIYIGFYCEPHLQTIYWSMVCSLSINCPCTLSYPRSDWGTWIPDCICCCSSQITKSEVVPVTSVNVCGNWVFCLCSYSSRC